MKLLHALSIGIACGIGAYFGQKIVAKLRIPLFLICVLATPLKAQVFYGDTTFVTEQRKSRGAFYVDTGTYIGHKKVRPDMPWVYEFKANLVFYDWWRETAFCQEVGGRSSYKDFKRFRWFVVNAESFGTDSPLKIGYGGYFLQDSMAFYIAAPNLNNKETVMHEMTHGLQKLVGDPIGHYPKWYGPFGCSFNYPSDST